MIPIYKAIEFVKEMEGGSTRPWLVNVLENGTPVPYVVKLYSEANNEQNNTVLKECLCSKLASEFEIETPSPALIEFTSEFIDNGLTSNLRDVLRKKDTRLKFATRLIKSGYENYSPQLTEKYLRNYDLATIYAFDNLILNVDRRIDKPNLFFKDSSSVLLDHELTLATTERALTDLSNTKWTHNFARHIFFNNLRDQKETGIFDTFLTYSEKLVDFGVLSGIHDQLQECGHPTDQIFVITAYFRAIKANPQNFVRLIEKTIA